MIQHNVLQSLSDSELLLRLSNIVSRSRRVEAELVAHIAEVDRRRLYIENACSSMFTYCTEVLHLSEPEAYLRIQVGRTARRFPAVLAMLEEGRLHLSGIALLAPHLADENCDEVLARAAHRSKRQIEELVAELAPKPDVLPTIRKLPAAPPESVVLLRPDGVESSTAQKPVQAAEPPRPSPQPPARPVPLAPERFKVTFTASRELKEKLERLQAMVEGDLEAVIEAAVTEKLEKLEARRFAATKKPRKDVAASDTAPKSRYIPSAVKRTVWKRDGNRCTFVDESGRRCSERQRLEFHHEAPFGLGGRHDPDTMRLLCRRHNLYLAERDYGKELIDKYRNRAGRVSESAPNYGFVALSRDA
jgi:hypothetical protein